MVLIVIQAGIALSHTPSYLTAYNPLLGGIRTAQRLFLVGWGEGLAEAAGYLNERTESTAHVAAWYGQNGFGPFFHGQSHDLYYDTATAARLYAQDVDYVVTYISQEQRHLLDPGIREALGQPLFTSEHQGVPLAQVFAWPKPCAHTTDRLLVPGLRLLGWTVGEYDASAGKLPLTLYWDRGELEAAEQSQVVAWIKDEAGEVWATVEEQIGVGNGAPADGWLGQAAVAHTLRFPLPVGLLPGPYRIELAPFGGQSIVLDNMALPATPAPDPVQPIFADGTHPPATRVTFGGTVELAGYTIASTPDGEFVLDLLWLALEPPMEDYRFFVHAVDEHDQIVAQQDAPLARLLLPDGTVAGTIWQQGTLARQRVHLPGAAGARAIYVGIYRPADNARLPLIAGDTALPEGRYRVWSRD